MNKLLLLIFFLPSLSFAQIDSTDIIVKQMMEKQKIVGLSLAVIKNGQAVVNKGYGLANVELNVPVTSETVIRLGSVSKQFFTTAIMTLVEEGKLDIEDAVHKFFPDAPEIWQPIKIKHLMSHTSGLQREGPAYDNNKIQSDLDIIKSAYNLPLVFKTGEKYQYCNLAYFMLADIIKQVSGMPWQDYMRDKLFIPAGMNNTYLTDFYQIIPNRANGYMHKKDTLINATAMYAIRPSGGFLSTSSDMIKWEKAIREKEIILKKNNWEKLWQPFIKTSNNVNSKEYYGFGWTIDEYNGRKLILHGGANIGFRSVFAHFENDGLSIIILTNTDEANPRTIANTLADYYFRTSGQTVVSNAENQKYNIVTGAEQTEKYVDYLKNKRVAVLANPTTIIGKKHLVDSLISRGINIMKVFGPEHGFRGNASNGAVVADEKDPSTGIKIISLYGNKRKPSLNDLSDVDIVIFDIQDVGCRFYTYINVLRDVMEACAENKKEVLILDRPNPNGYLVDGPVLDMQLKSGIGQFPIPIAHGMTIGEFAQMINGEKWLPNNLKCKLKIIPVKNYEHDMPYILPVSPSPNLNTPQSILLYPSTCLFEGTFLNHGRGTYFPFTLIGSPNLKDKFTFSFIPTGIKGMSETPLYKDEVCYGIDLRQFDVNQLRKTKRINLNWMIDLYKAFPEKDKFFDRTQSTQIGNIDFLTGVYEFKKQIIDGQTIKQIQKSWEPKLSEYKIMRKKYLLYK
jgi:uncharacterized protein YbbC (DUF1343 family)/CubicO group peptidase (beta-lactamase class C family)